MADSPPVERQEVQAVRTAWAAIGQADAVKLETVIGAEGDEQRLTRDALARAVAAIEVFDRAVTRTFGPPAAKRWGSAGTLPGLKFQADPNNPKQAIVSVAAPEASIAVRVIEEAGRWKLSVDGVRALLKLRNVDFPLPNDEAIRRMNEMGEAVNAAARDVLAKEYPTAQAAAEAGRQALDDACRGKNAQ